MPSIESTKLPQICGDIGRLLMLYSEQDSGIYVEAGANDGLHQSNSLMLEFIGWTGVLIEPSPVAFSKLEVNRPRNRNLNVAISSESGTITGSFANGSLAGTASDRIYSRLSTLNKLLVFFGLKNRLPLRRDLISVPAKTLEQILISVDVTSIDILILDIEGYEFDALIGLGFIRPRIIVVETRDFDCFKINELLLRMGYVLLRNLSNFTRNDKGWSGDHQDFAWALRGDCEAQSAILDATGLS